MNWEKSEIKEMIEGFNQKDLSSYMDADFGIFSIKSTDVDRPRRCFAPLHHTITMNLTSPDNIFKQHYNINNTFKFDDNDILKEYTTSTKTLWVKSENIDLNLIKHKAANLADKFGLITNDTINGKEALGFIVYEGVHEGHVVFKDNKMFPKAGNMCGSIHNYAESMVKPFLAAKILDETVYNDSGDNFPDFKPVVLR